MCGFAYGSAFSGTDIVDSKRRPTEKNISSLQLRKYMTSDRNCLGLYQTR